MDNIQLNKDEIKALGAKLGSGIKSEEELAELTKSLRKSIIEAALGGEMTEHLGYEKHASEGVGTGNSRNGKSKKTLKGDHGEVNIEIPRDRAGTFEPQIVKKGQTRLTAMDDQILALYAKGMSTRDIVSTFKDLYDADVSPSLISRVTDSVLEQVEQWQNRELDALYPIVYLDCIVLKIRENQRVIKRSMYVALGINLDGQKELLGLWLADTEGAKFWLSVLTELKNRGVEDILIACVDGLKGFPEAIASAYPQTQVQLCIVHMVRNSLRFVPWKDYKAVTADLKTIYQASTEKLALQQLDAFERQWGEQYPQIIKSWRDNWDNIATLFQYPPDIRKAIYTTNAIESLNSVIRKATKQRKVFPTNQSAMKVVYLAITAASKKWTMPIRNWKLALNRFTIEFGERVTAYL
jgi:transposase-like protein